ncbi:NUDIX hydrolase [Candidatus Woesearchaeota archaeon]|nr:NUDIX hydrolase [Candidatus Woesearchaeota archaeon]
MTIIRKKGSVIVETSKGILIVAEKDKKFMLPGGGANKGESRKQAAIRELYEETGLKAESIQFWFKYIGSKWKTFSGHDIRNDVKVFIVKTSGTARPRHEIRYIEYWTPKSKVYIKTGAKMVIEKYLKEKGFKV